MRLDSHSPPAAALPARRALGALPRDDGVLLAIDRHAGLGGGVLSIAELKQRLAHIPGIENLTMRIEGGMQVFSLGAGFTSVGSFAGDDEIEAAIRTVLPAPSTTTATPLPTVNLTEAKPVMTAPTLTGFKAGEISSMFQALRDRKAAMVADLHANGTAVAEILTAGERMAADLKAEGDALRAEFAGITNFPPTT